MIRRPRSATRVTVFLALALLAGCGQRGDLYLREKPPPGLKPEKPAAYKPTPYSKESVEEKGAGESRK
ncbi:MAG: LPS translocon maturation chaperone LptM [Betaproteobacteria bacterium]